MVAYVHENSRTFGRRGWIRDWALRGVAAVQLASLAVVPAVATLGAAPTCLAAPTLLVRLTLANGSKVEGRLVLRAPSGYVLLIDGQERRYPYYDITSADEWPEGTPQPVPQPRSTLEPPRAASLPADADPAERPKPANRAQRAPASGPAPVAKAERAKPRLDDLMVDAPEQPEVPGRGLSTVGWFMFGIAGGGATVFALSGEASGKPQLEAAMVLGAVAGLAMAGEGIGRRNDAMQRLNRWRRARGLRELDVPPGEESRLYVPEMPQAPQSTWTIAPAWAPGTGALVLSATF